MAELMLGLELGLVLGPGFRGRVSDVVVVLHLYHTLIQVALFLSCFKNYYKSILTLLYSVTLLGSGNSVDGAAVMNSDETCRVSCNRWW